MSDYPPHQTVVPHSGLHCSSADSVELDPPAVLLCRNPPEGKHCLLPGRFGTLHHWSPSQGMLHLLSFSRKNEVNYLQEPGHPFYADTSLLSLLNAFVLHAECHVVTFYWSFLYQLSL